MPPRNAVGRNTAISTSVMPMIGPITSSIALIVASLGRRARRASMWCDGVLDDHDRVVDHDADRQHQAEQREHVDREAERRHRRERADDRHRHGRRRDQHRPPVLEEDQDHDQHQHAGLDERLVDLVDRLRRRTSWCRTGCRSPCPAGNDGFSRSIAARTSLGDVERVGARELEDGDVRPPGLPLLRDELVVGLAAELDAGDVAQPRDRGCPRRS